MRKFYQKMSILLIVLCMKFLSAQSFTENFDNITTLAVSGWAMQNNSSPVGVLGWFQGTATTATPTPGPFNSYNGAANSYVAANFNSTGSTGTISNWLITPNRTSKNGDVFTFYTRKPTIGVGQTDYPDRLEVRMSTNGASTNVGSGATALGDFNTLLLSINPTLVINVYPQVWTRYTITISGLPAPTSGRLSFRYFVTGAGTLGNYSDYIGIDNVVYTPYTCPTFTMTGSGALAGGAAGSSYSNTISQTGALGTPSFAVTAGALPPGLILSSSSGTISGTPTATGTFNFSVTASDASGYSGSQAYSITIVCPANPIVITNFPILCSSGGLYTLAEASPAGGTYSGTGVSGGQFDPAAGTQTITYDYTDPYGCFHFMTKTIIVNTTPSAPTGNLVQNFSAGDTLSVLIANGENIKWYATSANAANHTDNLALSTIIVNNTTYYATQTVGGCESILSLAVKAYNETLNISDLSKTSQIGIYPNPVKDVLNFSGQDKINKVVITSIDGKKVSEMLNGERKLNVHNLAKGIYLINIFTENGVQTIKFIKN
ncbi:choice-of-anchor J domain-containing protein [Epilithonimonas sp. UC225_85]|uniref:choice-of-anchor J domain-containing protein n=1 Tax=Epilithonimonas sp. UC225_85 TaxID=3350167 RepID=UPI0036D42092